jgi:hypothetical protein
MHLCLWRFDKSSTSGLESRSRRSLVKSSGEGEKGNDGKTMRTDDGFMKRSNKVFTETVFSALHLHFG